VRKVITKTDKIDQKVSELNRTGTLNPHPEAITDPLFKQKLFFDPADLVQSRYEMLRRHYAEGVSVVDAAQAFGVSRPTFYQAGLLPKQRGPKRGHKLSPAIIEYATELKTSRPGATAMQCLQSIQRRFGITIHRRTLERALLLGKRVPLERS
jgi:transposase